MKFSRRHFLMSALGGAALATPSFRKTAPKAMVLAGRAACLVDTTRCIGCRQCEAACNRRNHMPAPDRPFEDRTALSHLRRPDDRALTVVNRYPGPSGENATFCKFQCMHCLKPACVSACIVGALTLLADGSVVYNPRICIGCRYCMIACPFQIPAYEYHKPLRPLVRKCEFCADPGRGLGADPACAAACPTETIAFGRRSDLVWLAHQRIASRPGRYLDHVYGEREAGGTSWLYLAGRPFPEIGLLDLPDRSPALRTESVQHGVYRYGLIPIALYGLLGGLMWGHRRLQRRKCSPTETPPDQEHEEIP